jgi:hypothetical protein
MTAASLLTAGGLFYAAIVPPAPLRLDTTGWADLAARTVPGAYHIHTLRSDGVGDKAAVASAAARAGLRFVILTDHGDGTRPPDPPEYVNGVLCLDGVEISTDGGHYVALDMRRAPYPLGGAPDAVVEDVARLGGFGIAAHPDSPKPSLRWTDTRAPVDGIEWLNADSERRKDSRARMIRAGLAYFFRPGPALATLFDRPRTLDRWDRMTTSRKVVGLAATDAHGGVARRNEDDGRRSVADAVGIPSYEASFRAFSTRVILERPLAGDPVLDARAIYSAIRRGSVFTAIDGLAGPGLLDFRRERTSIVARATLPAGGEVVLLEDGHEVARSRGELRYDGGTSGAFRVEVRTPDAPGAPPIPWLVSNPIYVGVRAASSAASAPAASLPPRPAATAPFAWRIEKDPSSSAVLRTTARSAELQYTLGGGVRNSQFVALATDIHGESFRAIDFSLAADPPARVSVQARTADGRRWGRSFYIDPSGTFVHAQLDDFRPIGDGGAVDPRAVTSLLLVVDLTNAAPGRSGLLRVLSSSLVK